MQPLHSRVAALLATAALGLSTQASAQNIVRTYAPIQFVKPGYLQVPKALPLQAFGMVGFMTLYPEMDFTFVHQPRMYLRMDGPQAMEFLRIIQAQARQEPASACRYGFADAATR